MSRARIASAVVVAGLLLTQQACSDASPSAQPPAPVSAAAPVPSSAAPAAAQSAPAVAAQSAPAAAPSAAATTTSSARPTRSASARDPFSGSRQVYLLPNRSRSGLAVGASGAVELSDDFGDRGLFVLTEVRDGRYWIRTAKLRQGGEALCLTVRKGSGGRPGSVVTAGCDASAAEQLFRFRETGAGPRYTIRIDGDIYLVVDERGKVAAVPIGEGTPDIDTPFLLPDQGPADLPALD